MRKHPAKSANKLGFFGGCRRCSECGKFCLVRLWRGSTKDDKQFIESACCGSGMRFAKENA